ncbi:MAG: tetratricopeptide repeat protein [Planctomycetota bacterium]
MTDERFFDYLIHQGVLTRIELEKYRQIFIEQQKSSAQKFISKDLQKIVTEKTQLLGSSLHSTLQKTNTDGLNPVSLDSETKPPESLLSPLAEVSENSSFFEIPLPSLVSTDQTQSPESFLFSAPNASPNLSDSLRSMVDQADEFEHSLNLGSDSSFQLALPKERYEVLETLGEGGMGVVQRVLDHFLEREVALKKIKSSSGKTNRLSETQQWMKWRLRTEVSIMACLEHPNIVPLYDMQQTEKGEVFFTMRKIGGKTLSRLLEEKKDLLLREKEIRNPEEKEIVTILLKNYSEPKLLAIFLKICDAVRYAHSKEIIHRDLKPENIMVGEFGEVYVMDWGIAKKRNRTDMTDNLPERKTDHVRLEPTQQTIGGMGTLGYMSPEQAENASQVNERADIYSLGKILKQFYTLMSPMEESQWKITQLAPEKEQISSPYLAKIPLDISAMVRNSTYENPRKRYKSVQFLLDDLDRYLNHTQISVREYSLWEALDKLRKRYKQKIKGILIVGVSCLLLIAYFQFDRQREIDSRLQDIFEKVQEEQTKASQISTMSLDKNKKLSHLLNALNTLDSAMILSEKNPVVEEKKVRVGKELIRWCCETEEYELADYLVKDLQKLLWLQQHTQILKEIQEQIISSKNKNLMQQEGKIRVWLTTLKQSPTKSDILEKATLEISTFSEEEVLKKLLPVLKEGADYFLNQEKRIPDQDHFYFAIVTLLGEAKFAKSAPLMRKTLERLFSKRQLVQKPLEKNAQSELKWMILLTRNLASLNEIESIPLLRKIYAEFGPFSYFYQETFPSYKILLSHALALQETSPSEREHPTSEEEANLQRGIILYELRQYEQSISCLTQVLQHAPKQIKAYQYLGLSYLEQNQLELALQSINEAIRLVPEHAFSYLIRGQIREKQEKFLDAIVDYSRSIQLDSGYTPAYVRRGNQYESMKKWPEALADYTSALSINTELPGVYYSRGKIQSASGNFIDALKDFSATIELNPSYELAFLERGQIYYWMGDLTQAIKNFSQLIALNPSHREAYFHRGNIYYYQGNFEEALADYQTLFSFDVSQSVPYLLRIQVYLAQRNFEEAKKDCESLLKLDLHNSQAHFYLGVLHLQENQIPAAIQDFETALKYDSYSLDAYFELGKALKKQESWDQALLAFNQLLTLDPNHQEGTLQRADLYLHQKQWASALQDYQKIVQASPESTEVYYECAFIYLQQNQMEAAMINIQNAIRLDFRQARFYALRGQILGHQKQWELALSDYQKAIQIDGKQSEFYFERAQIYIQKRLWTLAIEDLNNSIELFPDFIQAYYSRANVYQQLGEASKSVKDYQRTIALNPDFLEAYYQRGELLLQNKYFAEAIEDFTKLIQRDPAHLLAYKKRMLAYIKINTPEQALKDCKLAFFLAPEDAELYFLQGESFFLLSEFPKAIHSYSLAIERESQNSSYYLSRGNAYFKNGSFSEALQDYGFSLQLNSENEEAHINRGLLYSAQGKISEAIQDFNQVIQNNPDYPYVFYFRGLAWSEIEDWPKALGDFSEAILHNPEFAPSYTYRGYVYYQQGNITNALKDYEKALKIKENFSTTFLFLGIYYCDHQEYEKALDSFNKAISKNKSYTEAYYHRGLFFDQQKQIQKAFVEWDQAIGFFIFQPFFTPTTEKIVLQLAQKYQEQNRIDTLLQKFETKALLPLGAPYPKQYFEIFATFLCVRASHYAQQKKWEEAWKDTLRYIQVASEKHFQQSQIIELQKTIKESLPPK